MNKIRYYFLAVFLPIAVTPVLAQFNSVQKKKVRPVIYTRSELTPGSIYKNNTETEAEVGDDKQQGKESDKHAETGDSVRVCQPLFSHPLEHGKLIVTSAYGYRVDPFSKKKRFHKGTDFRTSTENVYAMLPGRIDKIGYDKRLGNYIRIDHGDWEVTYAHLYTVRGHKGDAVNAGYSVGISGSTGRSTGEHLHVSVKYKGKHIDPYPFVKYIVDQAEMETIHMKKKEKGIDYSSCCFNRYENPY